MPKSSKKQDEPTKESPKDRAVRYAGQADSWKLDLKPYWTQMDKNEEMYQFYKREHTETRSDISLNTPFTIIEAQLAKENEATVRVTVNAKGEDGIEKFEQWVESVLEDAIDDSDVAQIKGTFRKKRERFSRQLKMVGNSVAEIGYCYVKQAGKVIADNPYIKNRHWKSVIFNPSRQFDSSDIYYLEDFTTLSDLEKDQYSEKNPEGRYKNIPELKKHLEEQDKSFTDDEDISFISGNQKIKKKNPPIRLLTRWSGSRMCVIANGTTIIREEDDPFKLGGHNLLLAMRYVVEGRPYAYGEIDAIYKPVRAQDTIMNQSIELVNKALRGSYILGPTIDIDNFMMVLDKGGAMRGDPTQVAPVQSIMPPAQAFQTIEVLEQVIERVARFSPYSTGVASAATDKTQGTKGGIEAIQQAAEPNSQSQIDDIEDMFMRPLARGYLKMIANMMAPDDVRYSLLKGESKGWVKATKNILLGKATIKDMVECKIISEEEAVDFTTTMQPVIDPMTGQPMLDEMGQPQLQPVPIPGADKAHVFDVDWLVDAKLDNQSAADKDIKTQKETALIQFGMEMGVQFSPDRVIQYLARSSDFEIDDLLLSPEEQQQQAMQMQQEQQAQMAQQQEQMAGQQQAEQQNQMMQQEGKLQETEMNNQAKLQQAMIQAQSRQPANV